MGIFEYVARCPECGTEMNENDNGNHICMVCLREFTIEKGELIEIETDIYHLV